MLSTQLLAYNTERGKSGRIGPNSRMKVIRRNDMRCGSRGDEKFPEVDRYRCMKTILKVTASLLIQSTRPLKKFEDLYILDHEFLGQYITVTKFS